jgi:hypothetical protein
VLKGTSHLGYKDTAGNGRLYYSRKISGHGKNYKVVAKRRVYMPDRFYDTAENPTSQSTDYQHGHKDSPRGSRTITDHGQSKFGY